MKNLDPRRLSDSDAEIVRRSHDEAIRELQLQALKVIANVSLADGVATPVSHGLGRAPLWVAPSAPRNPSTSGRIEEIRDGDRSRTITLKASGYGATITVDVAVI